MKKNILAATVLAATLFGTALKAQNIQVGAKAGLNFTGVSNFGKVMGMTEDELPDGTSFSTKPFLGFHGGLLVRIPVSEKFSIQPEVYYSMQGYASDATVTDGSTSVKVKANLKLSYVAIPVLAQYEIAPGFRLEAGPRLGILTSSKIEAKAQGASNSQDLKEYTNSIDFSAAIGAEYELSSLPLGFYIRYNAGFTEVLKDNDTQYKYKNQVGQAGVFFKFVK